MSSALDQRFTELRSVLAAAQSLSRATTTISRALFEARSLGILGPADAPWRLGPREVALWLVSSAVPRECGSEWEFLVSGAVATAARAVLVGAQDGPRVDRLPPRRRVVGVVQFPDGVPSAIASLAPAATPQLWLASRRDWERLREQP
jgi:hypothetical protein